MYQQKFRPSRKSIYGDQSFGRINEENNKEGKSTRTEMYRWILDGGVTHVRDDYGNVANLIIAETPSGTRYVKTKPDDIKSDNILKLPECC